MAETPPKVTKVAKVMELVTIWSALCDRKRNKVPTMRKSNRDHPTTDSQ